MNPLRVSCPTCGAPANSPCVMDWSGWIGGTEYHTARWPVTPPRGPSDQSLPPEQDPAHHRADRPRDTPNTL